MKFLVLDWGSYTQADINESLAAHHITVKQVQYVFKDKNNDDYFCQMFTTYVCADRYDAVFTVNFFPLVAKVCQQQHVKYLSWSYDNPLNVPDIEATLGYETNYVFLFDHIQTETYQKKGFPNVYHLPLAVNTTRLSNLALTPEDYSRYSADISFVGKLYASTFPEILTWLEDYQRGYLEAISRVQSKLYGCYLIDGLLTDELLEEMNQSIRRKQIPLKTDLSREQLSYAISTNITREERLLLLSLLSRRHSVSLYSEETHPVLTQVACKGPVDYRSAMPKVFRASRINLNITLKILQCGIPLRALDIMGAGGFLLSNYQEELYENFIPDQEIVLYSDIEDAIAKADFYLRHEDLRRQIAQAGQAKVFSHFSYDRQLAILLQTAGLV